jgi:hypothetical protein
MNQYFSVKPIRPKHSQKHYKPKSQKKQEITKKKKNERQQKQQHGQQHLVLTQIAIPKENPNNINPFKCIPNPFGQSIPKSNINQIHIHTAEPSIRKKKETLQYQVQISQLLVALMLLFFFFFFFFFFLQKDLPGKVR